MAKYDGLRDYLGERSGTVTLTLDEIDGLVDGLPASARRYTAWWNNDDATHPHCTAWGDVGYRASPALTFSRVTFWPVSHA